MSSFLLLCACMLGLAQLVRRSNPPPALADGLNWWVIYIALPAMVLELMPALQFHASLWFLVVPLWLCFALAFPLARWLGHRLHWSDARIGAFTLLAGTCNTSFVGYPLIEALRGQPGLTLAVVADQLGGFIALAVGSAITVAVYAGGSRRPQDVVKRVVLFPAFIAMVIGITAGFFGGWPNAFTVILHRLALSVAPLVLFSMGLRLRLYLPRGQRAAVALCVVWKLALFPLGVWALGRVLGEAGLTPTIAVLQSAMAPMFTAVILIHQGGLDSELGDSTIGVALLLSLISVPFWSSLLP